MKQQLSLAIIAALATLASASASAQSSVTIYGRLNVAAERQDLNGTKRTEMTNASSRIGFKGYEDLGGGLFAGFQLEHGFNPDNGTASQPTQFWARQSEVNVGSKSLGTVRFGNFTSEAYYATADYVSLHNHDTGSSADALYAYLPRNTDKVGYHSPEFGGFSFDLAAAAVDGASTGERAYDAALNFNAGALHIGAGYQKEGDNNQFAVSALYTAGALTFGGYVQRDEGGYAAVSAGNRTTVRLSAMYAIGLAEIHANVGRAGEYSNLSDSEATQYTVALNYNLSKRTKVYTYYTRLNDSNVGLYGDDFNSFAVGLRHNF